MEAINERERNKKAQLNPIIDEHEDGEISDPDEMIAEISFGKTDMQEITYLKTMSDDFDEYLRNRARYARSGDEEEKK